ncbi:hypothetical protein E4U53_000411 [Claviceps sorghi]|nr:hypothetical protein E4U53_000411 [Claviceps sorghi]
MSLNGLDDPKVVEAYEGALSEAGGWFLLQYEGRDEIQVLSRGNGGIAEVRNAIAEYEETSPLYGFLKYRRRSVIIKYLPEHCTRIIQARVAVHLNAVCERFSPFDTIFEIATASELKDSKLSAACSLHTASGSTSSSTSSLRRRRLGEIAEEEEDDQRATKRQSTHDAAESRPQSAADRPSTAAPVSLNSDLASSPEQSKFAAATTSDVPQFVGVNERRTSMDSDTYTIGSYPYSKPKVKLGPRPSVEANAAPQTAGRFRPVSVIPAGFRIFGRSSKKGKGKDGPSSSSTQDEIADLQSPTSDDSQDRPKTSSSSVFDSVSVAVPAQKKPTITPEKARLMKAMQLREKNKKLAVLPSSDNPSVDDELNHADDDLTQVSDETILSSESDCDKINHCISVSKDGPGVALEPSLTSVTHADQTSELAASDSHPASSIVYSSDIDQSTKASSISESTDETVDAKEAAEPEEVDAGVSTGDASKGSVGTNAEPARQNAAEAAAKAVASGKEEGETKDAITTIAGLSTTRNIAEDLKGGSNDEGESFENVALPVSKFSASAAPGPDDGDSRSPETADGVKKTERAGTTNSSPDLEAKVLVQDLCAATKAASQSTVPAVVPAVADVDVNEAGKASHVKAEKCTRRAQIDPIKTSNLDQRKEPVNGIRTAALEQTTPVLLDKTPTTPTVPTPPSATMQGQDGDVVLSSPASRAVSNPVRGNISPSDGNPPSARSLSSGVAYLHHVNQQQQGANNLAKKSNNIGSSISQRIKALEKLSASTGDAPAVAVRDRPSSTFFAVKKRDPPRSPFLLDRGNSLRNQTPPSPVPAEQNHEGSTEEGRRNRLERAESVTNRLSMFEYPTTSTASRTLAVPSSGNNAKSRPESVSVMARIVRDTNGTGQSGLEPPQDPSEYKHLELKQSPLMVDLQTALTAEEKDEGAEQPTATADGANEAHEQSKPSKSRQSLNIVKGFINERRKSGASDAGKPTDSQSGAEPAQLANPALVPSTAISSRRSSLSKDLDTSASPTDSAVADDANSSDGDKKLSRAGRFMRRLSNISGSRTKNSPSPGSPAGKKEKTLEPEPVQVRPSTTGTPSIVSYMGDVNVQFPDNLLWKRRNMSLDSQGFLILSALPVQSGRPAQGTKRYHLSEFRTPYIPDVEVQELPNSVVLDFTEGSGLQVACEDRTGQLRVLQTLQEAHATRGTTYGL